MRAIIVISGIFLGGAFLGYIVARLVILAATIRKSPEPTRGPRCDVCGSTVVWDGALIHYTDCKTGLG